MKQALFLKGGYKSALDEIIHAQQNNPNLIGYRQPYSSEKIKLKIELLSQNKSIIIMNPIRVYISPTDDLNIKYINRNVGE